MKSIDRLHWAVENDRKDLANYEAEQRSDYGHDSKEESPAERVLKNSR